MVWVVERYNPLYQSGSWSESESGQYQEYGSIANRTAADGIQYPGELHVFEVYL